MAADAENRDSFSAEQAYLFRHAVVRDAAYHLQPPGERAVLHALALDIITALPGLNEALYGLELAAHARAAQAHDRERFEALEKRFLKIGGDHARFHYDYDNAMNALTRLHQLLQDEPAERAMVADSLADLHERLGQWQEALPYFEEVRANAMNSEFVGRALVHLAWIGMESGAQVEQYLTEGEQIAEQVESNQLRIAFMMCRAKQYAGDAEFDKALRVMNEVIDFARHTEDWIQEMVGHSNAADYAAQAGDLEAARRHNDAAEKLARNPRTRHFLIGVLINRATLAIRRREFAEAAKFAQEAVQLGIETRSRGLVGAALNATGIALTGQGQYARAWETFEQIRPIIAETADAPMAARWLVSRSELLRLWGKAREALPELEGGVVELVGQVTEATLTGLRLELALCQSAVGQDEEARAVLMSLSGSSPLQPVYRAGLDFKRGDFVAAASTLRAWLADEPTAGVYAEPVEFLARAWLALSLQREGGDAETTVREALRVAHKLRLEDHPSPGLIELLQQCREV